jgi:hypothetical protein
MIPKTKSPALAMLGETLGRSRGVIVGLLGQFTLMVILAWTLPEAWLKFEGAAGISIPAVTFFFIGILSIFSVSEQGMKTGQNGYPPRMFRYPVSTLRLVAWPMLFGAVAMALGWVAVGVAILPRLGFRPPLALGALWLAASSALLQTLTWWPFRSNLTQLLAAAFGLPALAVVVLWPMFVWEGGPPVAWIALPIVIVLAFGLAVRGVTLDRRGDGRGGKGWLSILDWVERLAEFLPGARASFTTAVRAQLWFEWRSKGATLLFLVIGFSAFCAIFVGFLSVIGAREPSQTRGFLAAMFVLPLMLCWVMGSSFGRDDLWSKSIALSPFAGTRPLTSGTLVGIKLGAAALSMLAAYGFILATLPLWLFATGNFGAVGSLLRTAAGVQGAGTIFLIATTGLVVLLTLTWRGMVGAMLPVLTGRAWVAQGIVYIFMASGGILTAIIAWKKDDENLLRLALALLPWTLGISLVLKLTVASVAFHAAIRRGMISRRGLISAGLVWIVPTVCLLSLCGLLLPPISLIVWLEILMGVALVMPLGRMALAPLALDWNRHR